MATLNYAFKELSCKIVYYGCGLCGKTTNLIHIHKTVPGKFRGELVSLATEQDRTLFFDFLPLDLGEVKGFKTKFQLYTVPGQVYYNATRKLVLRGVDGIVFVADSQRDRFQENIDSLENLKQNLADYTYHLQNGPDDHDGIPWVLQVNKRDMPQISSVEELSKLLNSADAPIYEAVALTGVGVKDTLKGISSLVIKKLNKDTVPAASAPTSGEKKLGPAVASASKAAVPKPADDEFGEMDERDLENEENSSADKPKLPQPKPADSPAPEPEEKPAMAATGSAPTLNAVQKCKAKVRGMGLGSADLTLANMVGGEKDQFQLTGKVGFLGIFKSTWSRRLKFFKQEQKAHEGTVTNFWYFKSDDNNGPELEVYVKDDFEKSLFVTYIGKLGEVKILPPGKQPIT